MTVPNEKLVGLDEVLEAWRWLVIGAPSVARDLDVRKAVRTLMDVVEMLPQLDARYRYGSPERKAWLEWRAAGRTEAEDADEAEEVEAARAETVGDKAEEQERGS